MVELLLLFNIIFSRCRTLHRWASHGGIIDSKYNLNEIQFSGFSRCIFLHEYMARPFHLNVAFYHASYCTGGIMTF